jgi:hypothetical protein
MQRDNLARRGEDLSSDADRAELPPLHVALDGLDLGLHRGTDHDLGIERELHRRWCRRRGAAEGGDLVGEDLGVGELLGNLVREKGAQLLPVGPLHHAGVQAIHDHGLELAAQVLIESIQQLLLLVGCHQAPPEKGSLPT